MTRITEELVRKRAEHNECEIFSLEELSLHQQNIEKIEHLDRWCKDLKILYLHNNLIPKIENLGRLKKLEYINFTLNNITKIENLEGCESLQKLDFTLNFIGQMTSLRSLKNNAELKELYMTGNPCTDYEGYREYVIVTLPQLEILDGEKITKTERIKAAQKFSAVRDGIIEQERLFLRNNQECQSDDPGDSDQLDETKFADDDFSYWEKPCKFTPKTRIETYKYMERMRMKKEKKEPKKDKIPRKLIGQDGKILNVNEAQVDFRLEDDEENHCYRLELEIYKYMNTSLIDVDVQPYYVRVYIKGKVFQMRLPSEVQTETSNAQRSITTGHLVITMPKVGEKVIPKSIVSKKPSSKQKETAKNPVLEVTPTVISSIDQIVKSDGLGKHTCSGNHPKSEKQVVCCDDTELSDQDNPEVPPLV